LARRPKNTHYLILLGLVSLILSILIVAIQSPARPVDWVIRVAALLGYLAIFLSVLSSAYLVQLVRAFGRPFVKVHHVVAISGLFLMMLHPLAIAWNSASLGVFLPDISSVLRFLTLGGRVVWILVAVAAAAAWLRGRVGKSWRVIHYLNYLAFWLATAHAILIGTDFQSLVMRAIAVAMALATVAVLVQKRLPRRRRSGSG
jgi:DMSO/TMAO reductase YedYZ heme-binding membrane subunit